MVTDHNILVKVDLFKPAASFILFPSEVSVGLYLRSELKIEGRNNERNKLYPEKKQRWFRSLFLGKDHYHYLSS